MVYFDPRTRQKSNKVSLISCDKYPWNVIASDPDNIEHFALTPKPVLRATPTVFVPKQFQPAIGQLLSLYKKL